MKNLASKFKLNVELCKRKAISSSETLSSEVKVKQTDSDLSVTFEAAGKRRVSIKQVFVCMWKFHLLENVLLPGNQQRDEKNGETGGGKKKKRSPPPELREQRIKTTKLPAAGKTTTTKTQNKIIQEASESSVETTTFISLYNYVQLDFIQVKQ